jgi:hypothetical protein
MKRFGGFEFLLRYMSTSLDLVNETLINQIASIIDPSLTIDASKIASLFRISPPQASVNILMTDFFLLINQKTFNRFGITIKDGHQVSHF